MGTPWQTRDGRFSPFKLAVFVALFLPALWLLLRSAGVAGGLGPRPYMEAIHRSGDWAVRLWLVSLAITPFRHMLRLPALVLVRRMVGVAVFAYAALHFTLYILDLAGDLGKVVSEIWLRFYLTIGFIALLGLLALAATSTDGMLRRLGGRAWRGLHRLTYPLAALALWHFGLQSKLEVSEPMVMIGLTLWVLLLRWPPARTGWGLLLSLPLAVLATAGIEAAWYAVRSGAPLTVLLGANLLTGLGLRPAHWVALLVGGATILVVVLKPRLSQQPSQKQKAGRPDTQGGSGADMAKLANVGKIGAPGGGAGL